MKYWNNTKTDCKSYSKGKCSLGRGNQIANGFSRKKSKGDKNKSYRMKMLPCWKSAHLIALCVISLAAMSFGGIDLLPGSQKYDNGQPGTEFICTNADDGAALILNSDLRSSPVPIETSPNQDHWCPPNEQNECIERWDYWGAERVGNWSVTNPWDHPMGPVFDHRWEGFKEYSAKSEESRIPVRSVRESGTIVFSARGLNYMKLLLRKRNESCSQIIISAKTENGSLIHTCPNNASKFTKPRKNYEEDNSDAEANRPFITQYTWRTFILRWDENQMNISAAHNTVSMLPQSHDRQKKMTHLFVSSCDEVRVRFHSYKYLWTTKPDTVLTSHNFDHSEQYFCVEMLVSLCFECQLEVRIVDFWGKQNWLIGNIDGANQSAPGKLPSWQYVKRNVTLKKLPQTNVKVQIWTRMHQSKIHGRWAIDGFRKCPSVGAERTYRSFVPDVWNGDEYNQPTVRCEKLSYEGKWVVKWMSKNHHDDSKKCPYGTYGDHCGERCGQCKLQPCSRSSGLCQHGCDDHYLPPSCKIKLETPTISYGNGTTSFRLNFSTQRSEEVFRNLTFQLKMGKTDWAKPVTSSENSSIYEITTDGLLPGVLYTVRAITQVRTANQSWVEVKSPEKKFCNGMNGQPTVMDATSESAGSTTDATIDEIPERSNFWIAILLILAIFFLVSCICRRKLSNAVRRMHRQDVAPCWPAFTNFVQSATNCTSHNTPPSPVSPDTELSGIVGIPELGAWNPSSHSVNIKDFEDYVKESIASGLLESQFMELPRGLMRPYREGALPKNKDKNRYGNLIPYDETRVILRQGSRKYLSDYINASYIQGYCNERAYIATQGPKSNTVGDFWKMIWQEEVGVICMLVNIIENGESTCEQYWPEVGQTVEYNHIAILNLNQRVYADYTYRSFQLTTCHEITSRKVEHLQYTAWPAKGVPMYSHSIVEYLNDLRAIPLGPGPIVVHCAAGVGRTGTIILCDICLRHMAADATVDLFAEAKKMYNARANMLDNLQQYVLAHLMPTQCLLLLSTKIPCSDISKEKIKELKKDLEVHIRRLADSSWKDKALRPSEPLRLPIADHVAKNRFPKFMPVQHSLVSLKRYPMNDSHSDYISAVSVDGVRVKGQYIASQLPLPSTLSDFWRLVAEKRVQLIIILQRPDPEYFACINVIPHETTLNPVPYITVESKISFNSNEYFTTDELLLTDTSEEQPRKQNVTILTCDNWNPEEDADPPPPETLVKLWSASEKVSRVDGPTLVLCHDGVTGCGLYLALSVLLERMAVEQECDVIFAVRAVRRSRPEFVYSKAQFKYLYDAAMKFAEDFETYANFV